MQGRGQQGKTAQEPDKGCWVFLANGWAGSKAAQRQMEWRGDKSQWKAVVRRMVPDLRPVLASISRVIAPPQERRLVVKAPSKEARAMLVAAVRRSGVGIQAFAAITPWERANKATVYAYAQKRNLIVVDDGDRVYLRRKGAPKPRQPTHILLSAPAEEVQRALGAAVRRIAQEGAPPQRGGASFGSAPRGFADGRRYADVIAGVGRGSDRMGATGQPSGGVGWQQ